ncbi:glutaredoxin family protein [Paraglaciecola sp. L3A3]|uniref:glutaredoxin family protein n=1 Tax=Paraglaciecola sp. L3A3 TaxID=2686358 RepID=UPI00131D596E|nr:glutaredoxin family protein [Paraglaciecola sp. L3A3]
MELILYSGKDCCLCDEAETLIEQINDRSIKLRKVDVKSSTELYHLYGARIPVIYREDIKQELSWPFDSSKLREFIF